MAEVFAAGSSIRVREVLHGAEWASWDEQVVSDGGADGVLATVKADGTRMDFPSHPVPHPWGHLDAWTGTTVLKLRRAHEASAALFEEEPFEVFTRNVFTHAFHEPDPKGLLELGIPADRLMFGSDFPHPEGMEDPLSYADVVADLPTETQALIMGGALAKALNVES